MHAVQVHDPSTATDGVLASMALFGIKCIALMTHHVGSGGSQLAAGAPCS